MDKQLKVSGSPAWYIKNLPGSDKSADEWQSMGNETFQMHRLPTNDHSSERERAWRVGDKEVVEGHKYLV